MDVCAITAHLCCRIFLVTVGLDKDLELSSIFYHQSHHDSAFRLHLVVWLLCPNQMTVSLLLCPVQTAVCTCSDVLLSNLSPVLDCVTALLAVAGGQSSRSASPSSSLLSFDFLLFYCAAMALLCVLYCHLLA